MTKSRGLKRPAGIADIGIREEFGWRRFSHEAVSVWTKGYGKAGDGDALARRLSALRHPPTLAEIEKMFLALDGHFAVAARGKGWAFAGVDRVRSIPLAFARDGEGWIIDDQAERLRRRLGLGPADTDRDAALALGMAGYTIDAATLYPRISQLGAGEFVLFGPDRDPKRHRYYCYRPWRNDKPAYDPVRARKEFIETTLALVDAMMKATGCLPCPCRRGATRG